MKKLAILLSVCALASCTSDIDSSDYTTRSIGAASSSSKCRVLNVRKISVKSDGPAGTVLGAGAGGVAGYAIGGGDTAHILGAIGGAALGGIAGNAAQKGLTSQDGFEYVVEQDNGRVITTTQGTDVLLVPGDRCLVVYGERTRIIPYSGY